MVWSEFLFFFFFFQAEDGIRDLTVTGVQTCALPISRRGDRPASRVRYGLGQPAHEPERQGPLRRRQVERARSRERQVGDRGVLRAAGGERGEGVSGRAAGPRRGTVSGAWDSARAEARAGPPRGASPTRPRRVTVAGALPPVREI